MAETVNGGSPLRSAALPMVRLGGLTASAVEGR